MCCFQLYLEEQVPKERCYYCVECFAGCRRNRTRDGWVGSANVTSVQRSPPIWSVFNLRFFMLLPLQVLGQWKLSTLTFHLTQWSHLNVLTLSLSFKIHLLSHHIQICEKSNWKLSLRWSAADRDSVDREWRHTRSRNVATAEGDLEAGVDGRPGTDIGIPSCILESASSWATSYIGAIPYL